jgi:hypothetical protein
VDKLAHSWDQNKQPPAIPQKQPIEAPQKGIANNLRSKFEKLAMENDQQVRFLNYAILN